MSAKPKATEKPDYPIEGTPFFVRYRSRGCDVMERGTGSRGMARTRAKCRNLAEALEAAAAMKPSTAAEILAGIEVYGDLTRALHAKLTALGEPGTPLFVLTEDGGYEAVSEGLAVNAVEALFGGDDELGCWLISWRDPQGEPVKGLYCMSREDAERAWWILRDGKVVAGGPSIFDEARALELAGQFGGTAVKGTGWARPQPPTRCLRCNRPLLSAGSVASGYGRTCLAIKREEDLQKAAEGYSDEQKAKALELIADGGVTPLAKRPHVYTAVSSDGNAVYRTTTGNCNCPAGLHEVRCYHRLAVALLETHAKAA